MTVPWIISAAVGGLIVGPRMRASVFFRSTASGQSPRCSCPACSAAVVSASRPWRSLLPVTGRCPRCRAQIGPGALLVEIAASLALATVAARASSAWELAALAWLVLMAVPLAFIDAAVQRLPDPLTMAAFVGTVCLLAVAALSGDEPGRFGRMALGAATLTAFYLILFLLNPGGMGLGDAKLAASIGAVLCWMSWRTVVDGTLAALVLAAIYGGTLLVLRRATRTSHLPLGPFIIIGALAAIAL